MNSISKILVVLIFACLSILGWAASAGAFGGFIENRGQVDSRVKYYALNSRASVYFTEDAVVLDLKGEVADSHEHSSLEPRVARDFASEDMSVPQTRGGSAVYIRFEEANISPVIEACGELETRYNYFLGNDPTKWQADIPAYGEVVYRGLWPGVDLVFREQGERLTYSLSPASRGVAEQVGFRYEGADRVRLLEDGSVEMETMAGTLVHIKAVGGGHDGEFELLGQHENEGPHAAPLDKMDNPGALLWSTFLGGGAFGRGLCLDSAGNPIITGFTDPDWFPTTPGAYDESFNGGIEDVFVSKLSASGMFLLWSTFLGGSEQEFGQAVCLDSSGNPIVTGNTKSSDFPTTPGAYDRSFNGYYDVFVSKLSSSGDSLLWSTFLGGGSGDSGNALCLDSLGNPVLTGHTQSPDFPVTPGAYDESFNGWGDVFVSKLASSGDSLLWSTFLGTSDDDRGRGLCLDSFGNPVVTGEASYDFPTTPGAYDESCNGDLDVFVCKLSFSGDSLLWSTLLGGYTSDVGRALCLDSSGNPIVVGYTESLDFPTTPGAYDESFNGYIDVFVSKLSSSGDSLLWSTFLGGTGGYGYDCGDMGYGLCLDSSGNPLVVGYTESLDFPTTPQAYDESHNGEIDVFVSKISSSGRSLLHSTFLGGGSYDYGYALCLDSSGNAVVTGYASSPDFPTTPGAYDESFNGYIDVFVSKLEMEDASGVELGDSVVEAANLYQVFADPVRLSTTVQFCLRERQHVSLAIYDVQGQVMRTLVDGITEPGMHQVQWDGKSGNETEVAPGIYFLRMEAGSYRVTKKVVLLR